MVNLNAVTVYTHTTTRRIAGHKITMRAGLRYIASRPFAARGRSVYPVTIEPMIGAPMDTPSVVVPDLTYEQATQLINSFNNGEMSFDGRVW